MATRGGWTLCYNRHPPMKIEHTNKKILYFDIRFFNFKIFYFVIIASNYKI